MEFNILMRNNDMVLDEELRPLHGLTEKGKEDYQRFLEQKADQILFRHNHPFIWFFMTIKEYLNI